jgi:hypothetical protein
VLDIQSLSLDHIKGEVKFSFPTGDKINADITGTFCNANLFVGLQ